MYNLDKIPSRLKYYLLEYKDKNMDDYMSKFGTRRLHDLTLEELREYFYLASRKDLNKFLSDGKNKGAVGTDG
jgi:hypothetical protein